MIFPPLDQKAIRITGCGSGTLRPNALLMLVCLLYSPMSEIQSCVGKQLRESVGRKEDEGEELGEEEEESGAISPKRK